MEKLAAALLENTDHTRGKQRHYLLAFSHYRLAAALIQNDRNREASKALTIAISTTRKLAGMYPEFSDGHVLLGALYGMRILLSPVKAVYLGPRANAAIRRGLKTNPNNPRAYLMQGVTAFQTPGLFGGSDTRALELLSKGLKMQQRYSSEVDWGEVDLYLWLGRVYAKLDQHQNAKQAYAQALALSPGNCWVEEAIEGDGYQFSHSE